MIEQSKFDILKRINEVDMNVIRLRNDIEDAIIGLSKENQDYRNFFHGAELSCNWQRILLMDFLG